MTRQARDFFTTYEKANSTSDIAKITDLYAASFMFGGPAGVQAVAREDFLKVIPKMKAHYSSMGLFKTELRNVEVTPINSKYLLTTVSWTMRIHAPSATRNIDALATYILMRGQDDGLSIVFQIDHQDLATLIPERQRESPSL